MLTGRSQSRDGLSNLTRNVTRGSGWTWFPFCFLNCFIWTLAGGSAVNGQPYHGKGRGQGREALPSLRTPGRATGAGGQGACIGWGKGHELQDSVWHAERVISQAPCALPGFILLYKIGLLELLLAFLYFPVWRSYISVGVGSSGAQQPERRGSSNKKLELSFLQPHREGHKPTPKPPQSGFWSNLWCTDPWESPALQSPQL